MEIITDPKEISQITRYHGLLCKVEHCNRKAKTKGYCFAHYQRHCKGTSMEPPIVIGRNSAAMREISLRASDEAKQKRIEALKKAAKELTKPVPPIHELFNMYHCQKLSTVQIAEHFGVVNTTVGKWLRQHGLEVRTIGEANVFSQTGKIHSKEWNEAISRGHMGKQRQTPWMFGRKNPIFRNGTNGNWAKSGKREDIGIYVRSSWEANYSRYLNVLKEQKLIYDWKYEPDTFYFEGIRRGNVSYTPDFKVWSAVDKFEYHEVKGWMNPASKVKLKRMAKYYPDVKIVLIDKPIYKAICRQVSMLIPYWEGER